MRFIRGLLMERSPPWTWRSQRIARLARAARRPKAHSQLSREKRLHADPNKGDGRRESKESQAEPNRQRIHADCEAKIDNRKSLSPREQLQSALFFLLVPWAQHERPAIRRKAIAVQPAKAPIT
jgi:hypothetical protein